eukprot:SAG31_NODE_4306_length_3369_cov_3.736159_3_plen_72_part_00
MTDEQYIDAMQLILILWIPQAMDRSPTGEAIATNAALTALAVNGWFASWFADFRFMNTSVVTWTITTMGAF